MRLNIVPIFAAAIFMVSSVGFSQTTVTTQPVGFVTGTCKAGSDTIVSVPLSLAPEYVGAISGTATVTGTLASVTASGSPSWTNNYFGYFYYIKFSSGALNGKTFTITANDAQTLTFYTEGDTVAGTADGDQFSVVKYWTLGTLFPPGNQNTIIPTTNLSTKTTLGLPNTSGTGTNLAPNPWYLIYGSGTNGVWKEVISGSNSTNVILYPDTYFIIRHSSKVTADTTYTFSGQVNTDRVVTPLATGKSFQDTYLALQRPVGVKLSELGLSATNGFVPSTSKSIKDKLLVYDNSIAGINKPPQQTFILTGGNWVEITSGSNVNNYVIQPSLGLIIRKTGTSGGAPVFWTNDPIY